MLPVIAGAESERKICNVCQKLFDTTTQLYYHRKIHNVGDFLCECGKSFTREVYLKSHRQQVHERKPRTQKKFVCEQCEKQLSSKHSLENHLLFHSNTKSVPCDQCDKFFRTKYSLKK